MNMKNITMLSIKGMLLVSFMYAGTVAPSLSMRFNDLLNNDNVIPGPKVVLGLEASVSEGIFAGIDSDGDDHRLYVKFGYGTFGMGTDINGDAQFTVGANYSVIDRFSVNLDYVMNQLTDADGINAGTDPFEDQLRITLKVDF